MINKIILALALVIGTFAVGASAQTATSSQTANEGYVGYSFLRQHVKANVNNTTFRFHEDTDSHGIVANYSRYLGGSATKAGVVGLTGEVGANFANDEATLVTAMGGVTVKGRNYKYVQPSVRALIGGARERVTTVNLRDLSDVSLAYDLGAGVDFNFAKYSRYKLHLGADYLSTSFSGERQNAVRLTTGLIF